eukprot:COSAG02_NODE_2794_length_8016_cov_5.159783_10_plen_93_part_00
MRKGGQLSSEGPMSLTVRYNCHAPGETVITVRIGKRRRLIFPRLRWHNLSICLLLQRWRTKHTMRWSGLGAKRAAMLISPQLVDKAQARVAR